MADLSTWPPERLRALDRAVAKARGWTRIGNRLPDPDVLDYVWLGWRKPDGMPSVLEPVSLGCRETFEIQREKSIDVRHMVGGEVRAIGEPYDYDAEMEQRAPLESIAICLAYLAAKGVPFNG